MARPWSKQNDTAAQTYMPMISGTCMQKCPAIDRVSSPPSALSTVTFDLSSPSDSMAGTSRSPLRLLSDSTCTGQPMPTSVAMTVNRGRMCAAATQANGDELLRKVHTKPPKPPFSVVTVRLTGVNAEEPSKIDVIDAMFNDYGGRGTELSPPQMLPPTLTNVEVACVGPLVVDEDDENLFYLSHEALPWVLAPHNAVHMHRKRGFYETRFCTTPALLVVGALGCGQWGSPERMVCLR